MRILLLGRNYASVINSLHEGLLNANADVKSMTLDSDRSHYNNYTNIRILRKRAHRKKLFRFLQFFYSFYSLRKALKNVDVVHIFSDFDLENRFFSNKLLMSYLFNICFQGKKFITFLGSEVRNPEKELEKNSFFKYAYYSSSYEYQGSETVINSNKIQEKYSSLGFNLICSVETEMFVNTDYFKTYEIYHHPSIAQIETNTKFENKKSLKFVHAPTAPVAKGSEFVLKAIAELEKDGLVDFEFKLLKGISNENYVKELNEADVLIDQFIWGWYGVATQQALQLGKIVICNLHNERIKHTPDNPIINANIHNLKDEILKIINMDKEEIDKIKSKSINYFNKFHSVDSVAHKCLTIYSKDY
jgi:hypothetical protein